METMSKVRQRTALPSRTGCEQTGQATGLVPVKGLDRCGTVPGSHRTSLDWLLPRQVIRALKPYECHLVDVNPNQMIRYRPGAARRH
jgi:hypothetical protein